MVFQFSPALGGERNTPVLIAFHKSVGVSILTRPWGRVQLRVSVGYWSVVTRSFNSHPPLGASATHPDALLHRTMHVSILTRPWGRVQRILQWIDGVFFEFQFSPALGGECNPTPPLLRCRLLPRFNSHPPLGASATQRDRAQDTTPRAPDTFQFSPALGGECNNRAQDTTPRAPDSFNSHPPLGASATVSVYLKRRTICKS